MNKKLLIAVIVGIAALLWYYSQHPLTSKVKVHRAVFIVDVAITEAQKELGLGGRDGMAADHGMLFPYDHKEQYGYWMRGMKFPLDFIWIDGKKVADVTPNVPQPTGDEKPVIVKPLTPVDKVLEVNAGTVARLGITVGDPVEFLDR